MNLKIRPHPFESSIDDFLIRLGIELKAVKEIFDSATSYHCIFNGIEVSIGLPIYVPSSSSNLVRVELTFGKSKTVDAGRILFAIMQDMDHNQHIPLRTVVKNLNTNESIILLQFVGQVDGFSAEYLIDILISGLDLADFYREHFLFQTPNKHAG